MRSLALTLPFLATLTTAAVHGDHDSATASAGLTAKRVAIIGAGAAGSSTAYHLSRTASNLSIPLNITVYERNSYIGGRTTTVNAWSSPHHPVELGGSIFVSVNHILVSAAEEFNLSTTSFEERYTEDSSVPEIGIWDGKQFAVVMKREDGWWDKARLLWRYGLAPIKTNSLMKSTVAKFLRMYEEPVFPWRSLSEVAARVGLVETTGVTGEQFLKSNGVGDLFAREIVQASTRVNYASNLGLIHGLETMVCMATSGAMAIAGGNWQIFSHMLASSKATTRLSTSITHISKQPDGTYVLTTSTGDTEAFDTVVLATPFQFSGIVIDPPPKHVPDQIPYVALHVTLFASPYELSPEAFNLAPGEKVPQFVLTTLPEGEEYGSDPNGQGSPGFFSISVVRRGLNRKGEERREEYVYKIFSAQRATPEFLSRLLGREVQYEERTNPIDDPDDQGKTQKSIKTSPRGPITWIHQKLWHSYPYEYPRVTFEEMELDEGLWYTSGIESFISTMETSALMGKNVAALILEGWDGGRKGEMRNGEHGEEERAQGEREKWEKWEKWEREAWQAEL
ncbi:Prenylcysteine oxidase [Westerdykella ornata]|uniref:Prenylcysteine oxidase n=1 Tax=Westerdykella ornata TaxID=318751 RepID=A0A6A6JRL6_WESOR|nr:Prenylcysteine oxidase [Westerdykella ornata]KAF2278518.1 Prenylcysteine oxidase [Westerdykella ornata]